MSENTAPVGLERFCREEYPRVFGALRLYTGEPVLAEELARWNAWSGPERGPTRCP